ATVAFGGERLRSARADAGHTVTNRGGDTVAASTGGAAIVRGGGGRLEPGGRRGQLACQPDQGSDRLDSACGTRGPPGRQVSPWPHAPRRREAALRFSAGGRHRARRIQAKGRGGSAHDGLRGLVQAREAPFARPAPDRWRTDGSRTSPSAAPKGGAPTDRMAMNTSRRAFCCSLIAAVM